MVIFRALEENEDVVEVKAFLVPREIPVNQVLQDPLVLLAKM